MKFLPLTVLTLSTVTSCAFVVVQPSSSFVSSTMLSSTTEPPSLAQTHMQGPLEVAGSGKPLTREELDAVKVKLEALIKETGAKEPVRMFMDDVEKSNWRFGGKPDYSLTNYKFLTQRTRQHAEGGLEVTVENLVKTWEMERSHKLDPKTHQSVDQEKFRISANGGKVFENIEANQVGNYNVLLNSCPVELYNAAETTWEQSHDKFHDAFAAFPWEVLDVYSPPPKVAFTWRHWGEFTGTYDGNKGKGELVEMFGFATATVNDKLQLCDVEVFYNPEEFINVLRGEKTTSEVNAAWNKGGCPFGFSSSSNSNSETSEKVGLGTRIKNLFKGK